MYLPVSPCEVSYKISRTFLVVEVQPVTFLRTIPHPQFTLFFTSHLWTQVHIRGITNIIITLKLSSLVIWTCKGTDSSGDTLLTQLDGIFL